MDSIRLPAVAGRFYPGTRTELMKDLERLCPKSATRSKAIAVISPHAGYIYSGSCAGKAFGEVEIPRSVIVLCPNHTDRTGGHPSAAAPAHKHWKMPLGNVPVDTGLLEKVQAEFPDLVVDTEADRNEHSAEVQLPFLQYYRADVTVLPITLKLLSLTACQQLGEAIASAIKNSADCLIVASSDMTHYESAESAHRKDSLAIGKITSLDPKGLYDTVCQNKISMCGIIPTTVALYAGCKLGARSARLIEYTNSGTVTGDNREVVGYAGIVIS